MSTIITPPRRFVCGFLFDSPMGNVALIKKNRPDSQVGRLNGIGGLLEVSETPRAAMARKFRQEAGVLVPAEEWSCFHTERYIKSRDVVYFMTAKSLLFSSAKTQTDEQVILADRYAYDMERLTDPTPPPMYNLGYLIPMAATWLERPDDRYFES